MGNLEDYELKLEVIKALRGSQIKSPHHIPMAVYVHEADVLYHWAREDKKALTAAGLAKDLVEDLPVRCGAATEAEARWQTQKDTRKKGILEWEKQAPLAFELRRQLLHDFRFAFRGYPHLLETLKFISQGDTHAKRIQDLLNLATLGKANRRLLEAIPFDMSLLDKAAQASSEMTVLLAIANRDRMEPNEAKKIRDQAYSHLKEAVDEIRFYGQYVFRKNKDRLIGYRSNYIHQVKSKQARERRKRKRTGEKDTAVLDGYV